MVKRYLMGLMAFVGVFVVSSCEPLINPGKSGKLGTSGCIVLDQGSSQQTLGIPYAWRYLEFTDTAYGFVRYSNSSSCLPAVDHYEYLLYDLWRSEPKLGHDLTAQIADYCSGSMPYAVRTGYSPEGSENGEWYIPTTFELYQAWKLASSDPDRFGHLMNITYSSSEIHEGEVACLTFWRDREPTLSYRDPSTGPHAFLFFRAY